MTVAPSASGFSRTLFLFLFLLLEEELDVHATCGFFDHVKRLVLRIQSHAPPFFHVLPFISFSKEDVMHCFLASMRQAVEKKAKTSGTRPTKKPRYLLPLELDTPKEGNELTLEDQG